MGGRPRIYEGLDDLAAKESVKRWLDTLSEGDSQRHAIYTLNRFVRWRSAKSLEANPDGWVKECESGTVKTLTDHLRVLHDYVASVPTLSGFVPLLPKAGVFAHGQAEVVAHNLAVEVKGKGTKKAFDGSGACFLMTGGAEAAFVKGIWYSQPHPDIKFHSPSRTLYMQRVLFEKYWMHHWF